jgi:hypothetical protein
VRGPKLFLNPTSSTATSPLWCRLVQRTGGPYLLEVKTPVGYQPIAPVMVELDGPLNEHVIHLVRF